MCLVAQIIITAFNFSYSSFSLASSFILALRHGVLYSVCNLFSAVSLLKFHASLAFNVFVLRFRFRIFCASPSFAQLQIRSCACVLISFLALLPFLSLPSLSSFCSFSAIEPRNLLNFLLSPLIKFPLD